jgi:hypothetical protein
MRRGICPGLALVAAAVTMGLVSAPVATAQDPECDIILPAADKLEKAFDQPAAPNAGIAINIAESLLFGLTSPAAIDLRLWSSRLAAHINPVSAYDAASPDQIAHDLQQAREQLAAARQYCAV